MNDQEVAALQTLRRQVLADSAPAQAGHVNGLLTLMFRKLESGGFSAAYFQLSFWPQLAPLLTPTAQHTDAAIFTPFLQEAPDA